MKAKAITTIHDARPMPLPAYYNNQPTTIPTVQRAQPENQTVQMQIPILGGLFWISPLNYQLIEQVAQLTFAVCVIYYLRKLALGQ